VFIGKGRQVDFERVVNDTEYVGPPQSGKPIDRKLPHGAEICATGLTLPDILNLDQWKAIGIKLCTIDTAMQWAIGDWWAYGHHTYGKRKAFATAKELPYQFGSLMNLGSVARSVKTSLRNEALTYSHHVAVAALESEDQKKWLTKAVKGKWSVNKLRELINEWRWRELENCPGFGGLSQAESWLFNFLNRARRAERAGSWPHNTVEPLHLDCVTDAAVAELVEAASKAAEAWSEVATSLKGYQHKRAATGISDPCASSLKKSG
jgi:hypothetical protein